MSGFSVFHGAKIASLDDLEKAIVSVMVGTAREATVRAESRGALAFDAPGALRDLADALEAALGARDMGKGLESALAAGSVALSAALALSDRAQVVAASPPKNPSVN